MTMASDGGFPGTGGRYIVQVFVGALSHQYEALSVEASKQTTADEIVACIVERLSMSGSMQLTTETAGGPNAFELAEVMGDWALNRECKERRLGPNERPVAVMLLWPKATTNHHYRFYLREKVSEAGSLRSPEGSCFAMDPQLVRDYFYRFLYQQPTDREYPDLCQLPDLNQKTLIDNLRARFHAKHIYTYVGSILIALNPFKFHPIYNPKYVKLYQNRRLGELPPHIFAIADSAYQLMLRERRNQCVVISGESGSGKTESTNFLLHHLTALASQKGSHASGVEQTILSAGPVLEAFGNAKTAHNNNSSRFGKFIQVNYKENGMVHGAVVQKYLLEKSRICRQGRNERNYHVFYYLLAGASDTDRKLLYLQDTADYNYLNGSNGGGDTEEIGDTNSDENYEFSRLKQSMEMVGFTAEKQRRLFAVLSAVLLLGNVEFQPRKSTYHHDEAVAVKNQETVALVSQLLRVKHSTLLAALLAKRARASGETLVINYRLPEAIAARDAMAKCLYGALFDWIVLQVNHALLSKKDTLRDHQGNSIGVLDIFGFEDFGPNNSFEQLCINYANEHLQHYFNQHVFKYEQEEYYKEGIKWSDIHFLDNTACLNLIQAKPNGLLCLLDDQCNFPGASNETLLQKFNSVHRDNNQFYEMPQKREPAFIIKHYAGKVKYQVAEMREKNLDLMRTEMVGVLKKSSMAFVRELVGCDPVAVFRWAILRAFFRANHAFNDAGRKARLNRADGAKPSLIHNRVQNHIPNENVIRKNKSFRPRERGAGGKKGLKNLQTVKTLAGRTANVNVSSSGSTGGGKGRKQPLTVTAQFQHSLHSLMDTLNQANPFFIRCIKSNADKIPNKFDDETVQRQLRYTGMLETVRIRQAGYNVRLSYDEFIQLYRILLPRGLLSSQTDVREFLLTLNLNRDNYQTGGSKIFLRECEKLKLDYRLHQQIVASIVAIQRWFRALLQRRRFTRIRQATLILQSYWRMWAAQKFAAHLRQMETAAVRVQSAWRAHHTRTLYRRLREATISFQAHCRGYLTRQRHANSNKMQQKQSKVRIQSESSTMDPDQDDQHYETMKRLKALSANDNETREIRLGDPNKEILGVDTKKKQRNVPKSLPDELSLINKVERKGSCDSLASQRSNDSQSNSAPVRDTLYRAKKQIQALMGIVKKDSTSPVSPVEAAGHTSHGLSDILSHCHSDASQCHSDSEMESNFEWMRHCTPATVIEYITPTVDHISSTSTSNSPTSPMTQKHPARRTKYHPTRRAREHLPSIPTTVINYITPTIDHISSSSNSPTSPMGPARRCESHEPTAPRRTARRVLVQADSDVTQLKHSSNQAPSSQDLKRRNSDPQPQQQSQPQAATAAANKRASQPQAQQPQSPLSPLDVDRKSITLVTIAGHQFRKVARFAKDDKCQYCSKAMDALLAEGHKCTDCKQLFHVKCIQNGGVVQLPCRGSAASVTSSVTSSVARRKQLRKRSATSSARTLHSGGSSLHGSSADSARALHASGADAARLRHAQFSLTGTSEFTDRTDKIISDVRELQKMQDFITEKICKMETEEGGKKPSQVDRVFKQALREFKDNLVATYSVANKQDPEALNIKYKDLIANFLHVMETVCQAEQAKADFPVTMGVNAFRGFLNEFMTLTRENAEKDKRAQKGQAQKDKKRAKKDKKRTRKDKEDSGPIIHAGHVFNIPIINIPTQCEICTSFFMWPIERGLVCQNCKLTCHKKCYLKSAVECGAIIVGGTKGTKEGTKHNHVFGVPLRMLLASDPASECGTGAGHEVPIVVERLITTIEMYGLYTEGIYRKSGVSSKVRELKALIEEGKIEDVQFEQYQVHVLTSVLKCFFREMPEPLLPFDRYDSLLRAASLTDPQTRLHTLLNQINTLPKPNFHLCERLIFHLARVAQHEYVNRMSASALAIVFAPCILRTNKVLPAQDSLTDIARQTKCIETIITEQLNKVRATLADIDTLDTACHTANSRLSSLRTSKIFSAEELQAGAAAAAAAAAASQAQVSPTAVAAPSTTGGAGGGAEAGGGGEEEEEMLLGQLQEIQKEKALLTSALPSLVRANSDDDLLSTDDNDNSNDDTETHQSHLHNLMQSEKGRGRGGQSRSTNSEAGTSMEDCLDDNPIMV